MMTGLEENMKELCQMGFLTSACVQVIKAAPGIRKIPTSMVAFVTAFMLLLIRRGALVQPNSLSGLWNCMQGAFVQVFPVFLIASEGYERVAELWKRTGNGGNED